MGNCDTVHSKKLAVTVFSVSKPHLRQTARLYLQPLKNARTLFLSPTKIKSAESAL